MSDTSLLIAAAKRLGYDDVATLRLVEAVEVERQERARRASANRQRARRHAVTQNTVTAVDVCHAEHRDTVTEPTPSRADIYNHARADGNLPVSSLRSDTVISSSLRSEDRGVGKGEASSPSPSTAPRKASRAKPRTQIADDAQPSDRDRAEADATGLTAEQFRTEWRKFRDHHRAKGSLMADWSAAWRTWLGNVADFQRTQAPRAGPAEPQSGRGALARMYFEELRKYEESKKNEQATEVIADGNVFRLPAVYGAGGG